MKELLFDKNSWIEKGLFFKIETFIVREHLSKNESFMVKNSCLQIWEKGVRGGIYGLDEI